MQYVLDCSVAVRWLVQQTHFERAARVLERFRAGEIELIAPDVIVPELGHVLRTLVIRKKLDRERPGPFLELFLSLPIELEPARTLASEALRLALRHSATFYDALYLALAQRDDRLVLTADERMTRAFAATNRTLFLANYE